MSAKTIIGVVYMFIGIATQAQSTSSLKLLPVPKSVDLGTGSFKLTENFSAAIHETAADAILEKAANRMYQTLNRRSGLYFKQKLIASTKSDTCAFVITVDKPIRPSIGGDESYSLTISEDKMILYAPTTLGALHGLETILQLLTRSKTGEWYFPALAIKDEPRFQWRGLMIDVARHFIPVDVLERNIEAMAAVKMNVLHLHLTDNEGFRIESKTFPYLHARGSNGEYYTVAQIKELISFAEDRGIIIVPEFDMPGHTKSWFAGYPQLASAPGPYTPGPPIDFHSVQDRNLGSIMKLLNTAPFPSMDPSKESTYQFIDRFIAEMSAIFPGGYIHIGADENNGVAWKNNPAIVAFMKAHGIPDTHALQAYFVKRVNEIITKHHKKMVGWEELFSKDLSKDVTIQVWQNSTYIKQALDKGNPVLISKGFYLDLFMPAYVHYNNPDLSSQLPVPNSGQVQGGEAAQWTEVADKTNIETRIWPRAAAVAEKLWSSAIYEANDLYRRLFALSDQLDESGIQHIADYERALRRYSNDNFQSLETLTDVLTPVKGYKKLFAQMMMPESMSYQSAPLIQISDIVFVDSKVKWAFRAAVKSYLEHKDTISENLIMKYLVLWRDNDARLQPLFAGSAALRRVEEHSKNLSLIATTGLNALHKLKEGVTDTAWTGEQLAILKSANQALGETELCIIPEIEALVKGHLDPLPSSYPVF